jgi:hypothetical protein
MQLLKQFDRFQSCPGNVKMFRLLSKLPESQSYLDSCQSCPNSYLNTQIAVKAVKPSVKAAQTAF